MPTFTPTKATGSHFYRYQSAEHLDWLRPIILENLLYLPTVAQLNDPADCRPKVRPLSEEEMVTFLRNDFVRANPTMALDDLARQEIIIRANIRIHGLEWVLREAVKLLNVQMEQFRVYSLSKRFDNLSLWAKYAASHTGYCLEFLNGGQLFQNTIEVFYGDSTPFDLNDPNSRSGGFLVCKRPEWSNEEEVRLIRARGSKPNVRIEPQWLTRIILGKDKFPENSVVTVASINKVIGAQSLYRQGEMLGKKTDQVGIDTAGGFVSDDSATFDKLNQAVNSCKDLVQDLVFRNTPPYIRAILPVLVVPTGLLWQVDYANDGKVLKPPRSVEVGTLFLNHSWTVDGGRYGPLSYPLSHIELVTLDALPTAVKVWTGSTGLFFPFWSSVQ